MLQKKVDALWARNDRADWTPELAKAHAAFERGKDWGFEWAALVKDFFDFEGVWGYEDAGPLTPTTERPKQVGEWLGRGRKWESVVTIVELGGEGQDGMFVGQWWKWWKVLQPSERIEFARLLTNPTLDADGWSGVSRLHGKNGLIHVMATLLWWGEKVARQPIAQLEWSTAVGDVAWVLGELLRLGIR
ncbi:hypothetical protein C8R44DRAFT_607865 [Mycena epipterygia]|nr:hypothetical protein C8R44DRAFT_607865 [Mycena epipterygia]